MNEEFATHERLAGIETRLSNMENVHQSMMKSMAATTERLNEIHIDLAKYKGAWGMLVMALTAVWAVVTLAKEWVLAHWK